MNSVGVFNEEHYVVAWFTKNNYTLLSEGEKPLIKEIKGD